MAKSKITPAQPAAARTPEKNEQLNKTTAKANEDVSKEYRPRNSKQKQQKGNRPGI